MRHARHAVLRLWRSGRRHRRAATASTLGITRRPVLDRLACDVTVAGPRSPDVGGAALVESVAGVFLLARTSANAFTAIDAVCTHEGVHGHRRRRRHLRVSLPRVALQPQRPGGARPGHGVAASVRHHLRRRRRDDRALTDHDHVATQSRTSITCFAAPDSAPAPRTPTIFRDMSPAAAVAYLVDYEGRPDDVDARIGRPDHAQVDAPTTSSRPTSTSTTRASAGCSAWCTRGARCRRR